jgi:hypothetical protein
MVPTFQGRRPGIRTPQAADLNREHGRRKATEQRPAVTAWTTNLCTSTELARKLPSSRSGGGEDDGLKRAREAYPSPEPRGAQDPVHGRAARCLLPGPTIREGHEDGCLKRIYNF